VIDSPPSNECNLRLHRQQSVAFQSVANEILYGGAAGGGKSHLMRALAIYLCCLIDGLQVYLFRRLSDDLVKNHMTGPGSFPEMLANWMDQDLVQYNGSKNYLEFKWNKSRIWLCHCQHEKDKFKYQGAEIHVLLIDELTHFKESIYRYLRARCRLGGLQVPKDWSARLPLALCGSNPGGVGHTWVRKTFVAYAPPLSVNRTPKKEGGMLRQYIPAKVSDNPTLLKNDPDYLDRLEGLGDPALVAAMKDGDWDIVAGGALDDVWDSDILRLPRFKIPSNWKIDRSFDWGSSKPFSVGWWAEANGEEVRFPPSKDYPSGKRFCPPKGTLIRIAEWYGSKGGPGTNAGLKLGSEEVAEGIAKRERQLVEQGWIKSKAVPGPADSSIFSNDDKSVDCVATKMEKKKVKWLKSDKSKGSRKNGLQLLRDRLKASLSGEGPGIFFCENCTASFDLLPVLPRDENDPEDVDTDAEDHLYDEVRYKCLSLVRNRYKGLKAKHST